MNNPITKIKYKNNFIISAAMILLSVLFTLAVSKADVQMIGPLASKVGFATLNKGVFDLLGVSPFWDKITDLLAAFSIVVALCFALIGIMQLIQRKSIFRSTRAYSA